MNSKQRSTEYSTINPFGFMGIISQNSNITIDKSYIEKGTAFINAYENSNVVVKDCGTKELSISVSEDTVYQRTVKLAMENDSISLPPWVEYKCNRMITSDDVRPSSLDEAKFIINLESVRSSQVDSDIAEYRENLVENVNYSSSIYTADEKYMLDYQAYNNDISTANINVTAPGYYILSDVESAIKAVWPLNSEYKNNVELPQLNLHFVERQVFPLTNEEDKVIYINNVLDVDKFGHKIQTGKTTISVSSTTHKKIVNVVGNEIQYESENMELGYLASDSSKPVLSLSAITDDDTTKYYINGPYFSNKNYICYYKQDKQSGNLFDTKLMNDESGKECTFWFKYNDKVFSLYKCINGLYDNTEYADDILDLNSNYNLSGRLNKNSYIYNYQLDVLKQQCSDYQPEGFEEYDAFIGLSHNSETQDYPKNHVCFISEGSDVLSSASKILGEDNALLAPSSIQLYAKYDMDNVAFFNNVNAFTASKGANKVDALKNIISEQALHSNVKIDAKNEKITSSLVKVIGGDYDTTLTIDKSFYMQNCVSAEIPKCKCEINENSNFKTVQITCQGSKLTLNSFYNSNYFNELLTNHKNGSDTKHFESSDDINSDIDIDDYYLAYDANGYAYKFKISNLYVFYKNDAGESNYNITNKACNSILSSMEFEETSDISGFELDAETLKYTFKDDEYNRLSSIICNKISGNISKEKLVNVFKSYDKTFYNSCKYAENDISNEGFSNYLNNRLFFKVDGIDYYIPIEEITNRLLTGTKVVITEDNLNELSIKYNIIAACPTLRTLIGDGTSTGTIYQLYSDEYLIDGIDADIIEANVHSLKHIQNVSLLNSTDPSTLIKSFGVDFDKNSVMKDMAITPYVSLTAKENVEAISTYITEHCESELFEYFTPVSSDNYSNMSLSGESRSYSSDTNKSLFNYNKYSDNEISSNIKNEYIDAYFRNFVSNELKSFINDQKELNNIINQYSDISSFIIPSNATLDETIAGYGTDNISGYSYNDNIESRDEFEMDVKIGVKSPITAQDLKVIKINNINISNVDDIIDTIINTTVYDVSQVSSYADYKFSFINAIYKNELDDSLSTTLKNIDIYNITSSEIKIDITDNNYNVNTIFNNYFNSDDNSDIIESLSSAVDKFIENVSNKIYFDGKDKFTFKDALISNDNTVNLTANSGYCATYNGTTLTPSNFNKFDIIGTYESDGLTLSYDANLANLTTDDIILFFDEDLKIPVEVDPVSAEIEDSPSYILYQHSVLGKKSYKNANYKSYPNHNDSYLYDYDYMKEYEYVTDNVYELAKFKDWYNADTYINYSNINTMISGYSMNDLASSRYASNYAELKNSDVISLSSIISNDLSGYNKNPEDYNFTTLFNQSEQSGYQGYRMFSFNFKIPKDGWDELNNSMYTESEYYGQPISSATKNDILDVIPSVTSYSSSFDPYEFNGVLSLRYRNLKDTTYVVNEKTTINSIYDVYTNYINFTAVIKASDRNDDNERILSMSSPNSSLNFATYIYKNGDSSSVYSDVYTLTNFTFEYEHENLSGNQFIQIPSINIKISFDSSLNKLLLTVLDASINDTTYKYEFGNSNSIKSDYVNNDALISLNKSLIKSNLADVKTTQMLIGLTEQIPDYWKEYYILDEMNTITGNVNSSFTDKSEAEQMLKLFTDYEISAKLSSCQKNSTENAENTVIIDCTFSNKFNEFAKDKKYSIYTGSVSSSSSSSGKEKNWEICHGTSSGGYITYLNSKIDYYCKDWDATAYKDRNDSWRAAYGKGLTLNYDEMFNEGGNYINKIYKPVLLKVKAAIKDIFSGSKWANDAYLNKAEINIECYGTDYNMRGAVAYTDRTEIKGPIVVDITIDEADESWFMINGSKKNYGTYNLADPIYIISNTGSYKVKSIHVFRGRGWIWTQHGIQAKYTDLKSCNTCGARSYQIHAIFDKEEVDSVLKYNEYGLSFSLSDKNYLNIISALTYDSMDAENSNKNIIYKQLMSTYSLANILGNEKNTAGQFIRWMTLGDITFASNKMLFDGNLDFTSLKLSSCILSSSNTSGESTVKLAEKYVRPFDISTNLFHYKSANDDRLIINARKMHNEIDVIKDDKPTQGAFYVDYSSLYDNDIVLTAYLDLGSAERANDVFKKIKLYRNDNFDYDYIIEDLMDENAAYPTEIRYTDLRAKSPQWTLYALNKDLTFSTVSDVNVNLIPSMDTGEYDSNSKQNNVTLPLKLSMMFNGLIFKQKCRTAAAYDDVKDVDFTERLLDGSSKQLSGTSVITSLYDKWTLSYLPSAQYNVLSAGQVYKNLSTLECKNDNNLTLKINNKTYNLIQSDSIINGENTWYDVAASAYLFYSYNTDESKYYWMLTNGQNMARFAGEVTGYFDVLSAYCEEDNLLNSNGLWKYNNSNNSFSQDTGSTITNTSFVIISGYPEFLITNFSSKLNDESYYFGGKNYYSDVNNIRTITNSVSKWKTVKSKNKFADLFVFSDYSPKNRIIGTPYFNMKKKITLACINPLDETDKYTTKAEVVKIAQDVKNIYNISNTDDISNFDNYPENGDLIKEHNSCTFDGTENIITYNVTMFITDTSLKGIKYFPLDESGNNQIGIYFDGLLYDKQVYINEEENVYENGGKTYRLNTILSNNITLTNSINVDESGVKYNLYGTVTIGCSEITSDSDKNLIELHNVKLKSPTIETIKFEAGDSLKEYADKNNFIILDNNTWQKKVKFNGYKDDNISDKPFFALQTSEDIRSTIYEKYDDNGNLIGLNITLKLKGLRKFGGAGYRYYFENEQSVALSSQALLQDYLQLPNLITDGFSIENYHYDAELGDTVMSGNLATEYNALYTEPFESNEFIIGNYDYNYNPRGNDEFQIEVIKKAHDETEYIKDLYYVNLPVDKWYNLSIFKTIKSKEDGKDNASGEVCYENGISLTEIDGDSLDDIQTTSNTVFNTYTSNENILKGIKFHSDIISDAEVSSFVSSNLMYNFNSTNDIEFDSCSRNPFNTYYCDDASCLKNSDEDLEEEYELDSRKKRDLFKLSDSIDNINFDAASGEIKLFDNASLFDILNNELSTSIKKDETENRFINYGNEFKSSDNRITSGLNIFKYLTKYVPQRIRYNDSNDYYILREKDWTYHLSGINGMLCKSIMFVSTPDLGYKHGGCYSNSYYEAVNAVNEYAEYFSNPQHKMPLVSYTTKILNSDYATLVYNSCEKKSAIDYSSTYETSEEASYDYSDVPQTIAYVWDNSKITRTETDAVGNTKLLWNKLVNNEYIAEVGSIYNYSNSKDVVNSIYEEPGSINQRQTVLMPVLTNPMTIEKRSDGKSLVSISDQVITTAALGYNKSTGYPENSVMVYNGNESVLIDSDNTTYLYIAQKGNTNDCKFGATLEKPIYVDSVQSNIAAYSEKFDFVPNPGISENLTPKDQDIKMIDYFGGNIDEGSNPSGLATLFNIGENTTSVTLSELSGEIENTNIFATYGIMKAYSVYYYNSQTIKTYSIAADYEVLNSVSFLTNTLALNAKSKDSLAKDCFNVFYDESDAEIKKEEKEFSFNTTWKTMNCFYFDGKLIPKNINIDKNKLTGQDDLGNEGNTLVDLLEETVIGKENVEPSMAVIWLNSKKPTSYSIFKENIESDIPDTNKSAIFDEYFSVNLSAIRIKVKEEHLINAPSYIKVSFLKAVQKDQTDDIQFVWEHDDMYDIDIAADYDNEFDYSSNGDHEIVHQFITSTDPFDLPNHAFGIKLTIVSINPQQNEYNPCIIDNIKIYASNMVNKYSQPLAVNDIYVRKNDANCRNFYNMKVNEYIWQLPNTYSEWKTVKDILTDDLNNDKELINENAYCQISGILNNICSGDLTPVSSQINQNDGSKFSFLNTYYITNSLNSDNLMTSVLSDNYTNSHDNLRITYKYVDYVYIYYNCYSTHSEYLLEKYFGNAVYKAIKAKLNENIDSLNYNSAFSDKYEFSGGISVAKSDHVLTNYNTTVFNWTSSLENKYDWTKVFTKTAYEYNGQMVYTDTYSNVSTTTKYKNGKAKERSSMKLANTTQTRYEDASYTVYGTTAKNDLRNTTTYSHNVMENPTYSSVDNWVSTFEPIMIKYKIE